MWYKIFPNITTGYLKEKEVRMCESQTKIKSYFIFSLSILSLCVFDNTVQAAPFECFAVSDLVRIFEDGYNCPEPQDSIEIFGIRNEYVSAQCVIKANQDLQNVTVSLSPLQNTSSSASIPADAVEWNFVGSIPIEQNTPKYRKTDLIRTAPAQFPDYLAEEKKVAVKKGGYKAVYLTIKIPRNTEPGDYKGKVIVKADEADVSLPLHLKVYPLTLPDQRHLMVTEWYSTGNFKKFHNIDSSDSQRFYDMLKIYAENMAGHRQNVFRVSLGLITSKQAADGSLKFDFSKFDKWADTFWETGCMDLLETGFVARFGEGGWSSNEVLLRDFRVQVESTGKRISLTGEEFLPRFLLAFENHLREKGWLAKTVFHIADEPSNHNIMKWREASQFVHKYAPALRRMDAIETTHCFDRLEIWVPKLDHLATWLNAFKKAQNQGNELWFYTVGIFQKGSYPNKTVDVPLIESRILHWLNYRFGLKGYLHWGFNSWTDDPFKAPGQHRGDGWHVYPKKGGLINSLRWEQMRNGIQDYEYLCMLEDKISKIKARLAERLSIIEPSRRSVEIASQVVKSINNYDKNPGTLYDVKKQIINELLDLDIAPQIIVQTNPMEHSTVANDCAIDVFGWAQPGTKVIVNGRTLPLSDDGLFMENVGLSREHTIVVEAEHEKGNKRIVRSFDVLY
jgi:hypothetical protein